MPKIARNVVPIKIGHTSMMGAEQPMRGEVDKVYAERNVLYADLVDIHEDDIAHLKRHPSPSVEVKNDEARLQAVAFLGGTPAFHPMPGIQHFDFQRQPDGTFRVDRYPIFRVPFERDGFHYTQQWLDTLVTNFRERQAESTKFDGFDATINFSETMEANMPNDKKDKDKKDKDKDAKYADEGTPDPAGTQDPLMQLTDQISTIMDELQAIKSAIGMNDSSTEESEEPVEDELEDAFEDKEEEEKKADKPDEKDKEFMNYLRQKDRDEKFLDELDELWAEGKLFATPKATFSDVGTNAIARKQFLRTAKKRNPESVKRHLGSEFMNYAGDIATPGRGKGAKVKGVPADDIAEFRDMKMIRLADIAKNADGTDWTDEQVAEHLKEIYPDKYAK